MISLITRISTAFLILIFPILSNSQININVDDAPYNAVGDGVTNDHDAIQSAVWDLRGSGGTLSFTSGKTYIISTGITFNTFPDDQDYLVTSSGIEKATIKVQDGAPLSWDHWGFRLSESNNITVENLIIDGNRDTRNPDDEYSGVDVLFIDGASNGTRLKNLNLINSPGDNIYIVVHHNQNESQMTDFEMHNCKVENAYRNNMSVISGSNFQIIGCEFIGANGTLPEAGIDFEPNNDNDFYGNMNIEGCLFKDNNVFGLMFTHIVEGNSASVLKNCIFDNNGILVANQDNEIHHNIFVNQDHQHSFPPSTRDGIIYFHTDHTPTGNNIHDNYFYNNPMPAGSHLVNFMSNAGGGNTVEDNYAFNNIVDGFVLNNTNPATNPPQIIVNNTFLNHKEMGYWNMDNAQIVGNTIEDLSDFNSDGTIVGATSISGVINEALDFAPDNRYIEIPTNDNLNIQMNITIMAWIKWDGVNIDETQQVPVGRGNDWRFRLDNSGRIGFYAAAPYTAGWTNSPPNSIPVNEWKLVAATYNGRDTKIYVDGIEVASEQANGALGISSANLFIGAFSENTYSFNGKIDDVRIYNYSMEQAEIETIFNAAPLSVEWIKPLVANIHNHNDVLLEWSVAQQKDNAYFFIEHSLDGIHFRSIDMINGDGNLSQLKNLKYIDTKATSGLNYYRIKQVDADGFYSYSNIANVVLSIPHISITPNPASNIILVAGITDIDKIEVFNQLGEKLLQVEVSNQIDISSLSAGIFLVHIQSKGNKYVQKFIKH